jgi:hypothetical protein
VTRNVCIGALRLVVLVALAVAARRALTVVFARTGRAGPAIPAGGDIWPPVPVNPTHTAEPHTPRLL